MTGRRAHIGRYSLWAGLSYENWDTSNNRPPPQTVVSRMSNVSRPSPLLCRSRSPLQLVHATADGLTLLSLCVVPMAAAEATSRRVVTTSSTRKPSGQPTVTRLQCEWVM